MFCWVCGAEFVAEIQRCPLCDVPLVVSPPREEPEAFADEAVVTATEVWSPEGDVIRAQEILQAVPLLDSPPEE